MTEPAPYTDEDVRLVAGMIRGYVLGNLPDQHCDRLARQIVAELERAGRLRHGLLVSEVMAYELGREDAGRLLPEDARTEYGTFWNGICSMLFTDRAEAEELIAEKQSLYYPERGEVRQRWVGPWVPATEGDAGD